LSKDFDELIQVGPSDHRPPPGGAAQRLPPDSDIGTEECGICDQSTPPGVFAQVTM
jgi:hypothetical protein